MRTVTEARPRGRLVAFVVSAIVAIGLLSAQPAAAAANENELKLKRHHNAERVETGRSRLRMDDDLVVLARRQSRRMARAGYIFHNSNLATEAASLSWSVLGENVGVGPSIRWLHEAFMDSAPHRSNILNARFVEVGVGAIVRDGRTWVTVIFAD